jgi:hypothetical protein
MGLLLRVQPSGTRTYYVQVARSQRIRIGPAGTYTLKQAEEQAKQMLFNPSSAKKSVGLACTVGNYIDQESQEHALAKLKNGAAAVARVKAIWKSYLTKSISDISANEVEKFRNKRINAGKTPGTVNREVSAL